MTNNGDNEAAKKEVAKRLKSVGLPAGEGTIAEVMRGLPLIEKIQKCIRRDFAYTDDLSQNGLNGESQ
ncbi:MAG: hypothetical protein MI743_04715 [Sneathiellales bacterium]|nr:hypothetical protein [Sneathiellales bacterium]